MGLLRAMGTGGLGAPDPAASCLPSSLCFPVAAGPTNPSPPSTLILNPLHPGKNPAPSLAGGCSHAAGGHVASGFSPTNSTTELFQPGTAAVKSHILLFLLCKHPRNRLFYLLIGESVSATVQHAGGMPFPSSPPSQTHKQALF